MNQPFNVPLRGTGLFQFREGLRIDHHAATRRQHRARSAFVRRSSTSGKWYQGSVLREVVPRECSQVSGPKGVFSGKWYQGSVLREVVPRECSQVSGTKGVFSGKWYQGSVLREVVPRECSQVSGPKGVFSGKWYQGSVLREVVPRECSQVSGTKGVFSGKWSQGSVLGDPTPSPPPALGSGWRAVGARRWCLHVGAPLALASRPAHRDMAFWDLYYELHGGHVLGYKP
ncbi:unnamed protein product [Chrysodeixis includens]|uniref:Uncharacterized protein n=1 Tax=Chrysodeixis includens TaxID=689277 RepID=A0A9N8L6D5_CHRIL|nr:unnamed protein product [Chrysodeixis includens]